jgi:hypothetical protein
MRKISKFGWLLEKGWSISPLYRVRVRVKEVEGDCAMGYKLGNCFTVKRFHVSDARKGIYTRIKLDANTVIAIP